MLVILCCTENKKEDFFGSQLIFCTVKLSLAAVQGKARERSWLFPETGIHFMEKANPGIVHMYNPYHGCMGFLLKFKNSRRIFISVFLNSLNIAQLRTVLIQRSITTENISKYICDLLKTPVYNSKVLHAQTCVHTELLA